MLIPQAWLSSWWRGEGVLREIPRSPNPQIFRTSTFPGPLTWTVLARSTHQREFSQLTLTNRFERVVENWPCLYYAWWMSLHCTSFYRPLLTSYVTPYVYLVLHCLVETYIYGCVGSHCVLCLFGWGLQLCKLYVRIYSVSRAKRVWSVPHSGTVGYISYSTRVGGQNTGYLKFWTFGEIRWAVRAHWVSKIRSKRPRLRQPFAKLCMAVNCYRWVLTQRQQFCLWSQYRCWRSQLIRLRTRERLSKEAINWRSQGDLKFSMVGHFGR